MTTLDTIRIEFDQLLKLACQESGLNDNEFENLGFVEFAIRIKNPGTKENFCKLAINLLEENIRALQTNNENEYTSEWANTLLLWCTAREQLQRL